MATNVAKLSMILSANASGLVAGFRNGEDAVRRFRKTAARELTAHQSEYVNSLKQRMAEQRQWASMFEMGDRARRSSAWLENEKRGLLEQRDVLKEIAKASYDAGSAFQWTGQQAKGGFLAGLRQQFGRGSEFTLMMKTLRGSGAVIGLTLVSNAIDRMGSSMKTAAEQMAAGEKNWADLILEFTYSLPIIGGVVKGLSDMAEAVDYAITGRKTPSMVATEARQAASSYDIVERERRALASINAGSDAERERLEINNRYVDSLRELDKVSGGGASDPTAYRIARESLEKTRDKQLSDVEFKRLDAIYEHGKDVQLEALQAEKKWRDEAADAYKKEAEDQFEKLNVEYERLKERKLEDLRTEQRMRNEVIDEAKRREEQADREAAAERKRIAEQVAHDIEQVREDVKTPEQRLRDEWDRLHGMVRPGGLTQDEARRAFERARGTSDAQEQAKRAAEFLIKARQAGKISQADFNKKMGIGIGGGPLNEYGSEQWWRHRQGGGEDDQLRGVTRGVTTTNRILTRIESLLSGRNKVLEFA